MVTPFASTWNSTIDVLVLLEMEMEMTEYAARRDPARRPTHPGAILHDVLDATGLTRVEIAARLGISRQHLHDLMEQRKPVSPRMAVRLGRFLGNDPGLWLRMQGAYDLWEAEREPAAAMVQKFEPVI